MPRKRLESWRALEKLAGEGACRAIGVSNFTVAHLDELMAVATVPPAVNQFELHPFLQQREMVARSRELELVVAAYSPLTKARRLDDPALVALAREVGRSPAQVLIRWSLQRGFAVLPKSSNPKRIAENADVFGFALSEAQMGRLDALDDGFRTAWDPTTVE